MPGRSRAPGPSPRMAPTPPGSTMSEPGLEEYGELAAEIKEILIPAGELQAKVRQMGQAISQDYAGRSPLMMVGVLKGVVLFMADLLRAVTIPVEVDCLAVSSYSSEARAKSGLVRLEKDLEA